MKGAPFIILIALVMLALSPAESYRSFDLGTRTCKLVTIGSTDSVAVFLSLHDDENTSVDAFKEVHEEIDHAAMVELQQSGSRLLKYGHGENDYFVDPNRIFSIIGLNNSLKKHNKSYPAEISVSLARFTKNILEHILPEDQKTYLVALHNNTNDQYSIKSYLGNPDAEKVNINPSEDPDDFFLVTEISDFEYFKSLKRNVVLQSHDAFDDGSLSIYCERFERPYINIEAQDGHKSIQRSMIKEVYSHIKTK